MRHVGLVVLCALLVAATPVGALAAPQPLGFEYTITATGTEDVTVYPPQEFCWTVTTQATETWQTQGLLGYRVVDLYAFRQYATYYLEPPVGGTVTSWAYSVWTTRRGGKDAGTKLDKAANRLEINVYSGGDVIDGIQYPGYYSAAYYIFGTMTHTATRSVTQSGTGSCGGDAGAMSIDEFDTSLPPAEQGGSVALQGYQIECDNPNVQVRFVPEAGGLFAESTYSEIETRGWTRELGGTATVTAADGDKRVIDCGLSAPNGDTAWQVTDTNPFVETWIADGVLYARAVRVPVGVDIKPGESPNTVNLTSAGSLSVAVFGSSELAVARIDPGSLRLGGVLVSYRGSGKKSVPAVDIVDVNRDGRLDLVATFRVPDLVSAKALTATTTQLELTGWIDDGRAIVGSDSVVVQ